MSSRPDRATAALTVGGLGVATLGVVLRGSAGGAELDPALLAVVVATAVVGELLPLPRVTGRPIPSSVVVIGTYALLGAPAWTVVMTAIAARAAAGVVAGTTGRLTPRSLSGAAAAGWIATGAVGLGTALAPWDVAPTVAVSAGSALLLAVAMVIGLPLWEAITAGGRGRERVADFATRLRTNWMVETAMASSAILGAVVHPRLGVLAVPFLLLPMLAARSGLRGYREVQRQHDQTLRAMSRLPEELGEAPAEHGQRTALLVEAVARSLGTGSEERSQLVQAAQLHELGRIRNEPGEDHSARTIALNGANILQQSGLVEAARIVGAHRDHVLGTGPGATILRLACELDLALARTGDGSAAIASVAEGLTDPAEMQLLAAFDLEVLRTT